MPLQPARAQPRPVTIVCLGDSLTAGYQLPADAAFPAVLERALKAKGVLVKAVNAGVSGDTTADGLERLEWSLSEGADAVILELGANDMLRGLDTAIPRRNLQTIIERIQARHLPILLAGMVSSGNLGPDYKARFDAIFPDLSRKYGLPLYPFFLDGVTGQPGMTQSDGLHPTRKGVERMVEGILPLAEALVAQANTAVR